MDQGGKHGTEGRRRKFALPRWLGLIAVALFMMGAVVGRVDCASAAGCAATGQAMIVCLSGGAMACGCACGTVGVATAIGLPLVVRDVPVGALVQLAASITVEPELPPPRV